MKASWRAVRTRVAVLAGLAGLALAGATSGPPRAGASSTRFYSNPVFGSDFPDPMVLRTRHDGYYAYATHTAYERHGRTYPILHSRDLVHWAYVGDALRRPPAWSEGDRWAPSVLARRGRYYLYYAARRRRTHTHCIGVAVARRPRGPFADHGVLACRRGRLRGFIDPAPLTYRGRAYLYVAVDSPRSAIAVMRLGGDLLHAGRPRVVLRVSQGWERGPRAATVEAPWPVCRDGRVFLLYSGNDWRADYQMGYAVARSPRGPFAKSPANPLARGTLGVYGPGGGSVVTEPDGQSWLAYHSWTRPRPGHRTRHLRIDRMTFAGDAARLEGPSITVTVAPVGG